MRTLNRWREPALIYNSYTARPYQLIQADLTLPGDAPQPDSVTADLWTSCCLVGHQKWAGDWQPGETRRVAMGFDASDTTNYPTGTYAYSMILKTYYPGVSQPEVTNHPGSMTVVNRSTSPFGAGWWLSGLQKYHPASAMVVEADGSALAFHDAGTNTWALHGVTHPTPSSGTAPTTRATCRTAAVSYSTPAATTCRRSTGSGTSPSSPTTAADG